MSNNSEYEWVTRPPNLYERVIAGLYLMALVTSLVSYHGELRVFGEHDGDVLLFTSITGLVLLLLAPKAKRKGR
jgi:hypothetical protein